MRGVERCDGRAERMDNEERERKKLDSQGRALPPLAISFRLRARIHRLLLSFFIASPSRTLEKDIFDSSRRRKQKVFNRNEANLERRKKQAPTVDNDALLSFFFLFG